MKQPRRNKNRLAQRRASASARAVAHAQLTPQQKLDKLDARLGSGVGARRERTKLLKAIVSGQKPVDAVTAEAVFAAEKKPGKRSKKK